MIKKGLAMAEKHPAHAVLIGASVVAGVVAARALMDSERRESALELLRDQFDRLGDGSPDALRAGAERAQDVQAALSPSVGSGSSPAQALSSLGIRQKTAAVFLATLAAKAGSGYLRWRSEQRALRHGALGEHGPLADAESLEQLTVAELRQEASEREIEGRSSMNKGELIDALSHG